MVYNILWLGSYDSSDAGGERPEIFFDYSSEVGTFRLITPEIEATNLPKITLEYKQFVYDSAGGYTLKLQTKLDGGNWEDQWSETINENIGPETVTIDLSSLSGKKFEMAWVYDGDSSDIYQWFLDDISITAQQN